MTEAETKSFMRHDFWKGWYLPIIATLNSPNRKVVVTADGTHWNVEPPLPPTSAMYDGSLVDGNRFYPPESFLVKLLEQDRIAKAEQERRKV